MFCRDENGLYILWGNLEQSPVHHHKVANCKHCERVVEVAIRVYLRNGTDLWPSERASRLNVSSDVHNLKLECSELTQEFPAVMEKTVTKARSYEPKSSGAISPKKLTPMMASVQR